MPDTYPYIISNNKIEPILHQIRKARKPPRFTLSLLRTWGFTASNDRAILPLLKELGFLTENGTPTEYYDLLRDPKNWQLVLGDRVQELYAELFSINSEIQSADDEDIKAAISRVTGKEED